MSNKHDTITNRLCSAIIDRDNAIHHPLSLRAEVASSVPGECMSNISISCLIDEDLSSSRGTRRVQKLPNRREISKNPVPA